MKKFFPVISLLFLIGLINCTSKSSNNSRTADKTQLLQLEYKWLQAEFALDSAYLSSIIDSSFTGISGSGTHNKQEAILDMYNNISQRTRDSIVIDSFTLENTIVKIYDNTAVVSFIVHTHGKNKREITERRKRFFDVWIKRENGWKAVASQGSSVE